MPRKSYYAVLNYTGPDAIGLTYAAADWISGRNGFIMQSVGRVLGRHAVLGFLVRFALESDWDEFVERRADLKKRLLRLAVADMNGTKQIDYSDPSAVIELQRRIERARRRINVRFARTLGECLYPGREKHYRVYAIWTPDIGGLLSRILAPVRAAGFTIDLHDGVVFPEGTTPTGFDHQLPTDMYLAHIGVWATGLDRHRKNFETDLNLLKSDGLLANWQRLDGGYLRWPAGIPGHAEPRSGP